MNMAKKSNRAALLGERQKELKFDDSVTATGAKFIPVSFDTHGSRGPKFKALFRDIIKSMLQSTLTFQFRPLLHIGVIGHLFLCIVVLLTVF